MKVIYGSCRVLRRGIGFDVVKLSATGEMKNARMPVSQNTARRDNPNATRRVQIEADKPAEQQVVLQLRHQEPFNPEAVEHLQQQARRSFSGAIEGRPVWTYSFSSWGDNAIRAVSTYCRMGRSGWVTGTRSSGERKLNIPACWVW